MNIGTLVKSLESSFRFAFGSGERNCEFVRNSFALGTVIQLKAYGVNGSEAIDEAIFRINNIDNKMSAFKNDSEISGINFYAGELPYLVSEDTYFVIKTAVEYSKLTGGAFDPTVRPLVNLWNKGLEQEQIPNDNDIKDKLRLIGYNNILFDDINSSVMLKHSGQAIDLGGIAKGYAADQARDIFLKHDINSALIDLGGNIFALGSKRDGTPWKVGIQNPFSLRGQYLGVLKVKNKSVVTSGNYEKYFIKAGKRYHHIIDPRTGYPSESSIISATIISDNSLDGDGLSTGIYILGVKKALELIETLDGIEAILITDDKKVYVTSGINEYFESTDKDFTIRSCNRI